MVGCRLIQVIENGLHVTEDTDISMGGAESYGLQALIGGPLFELEGGS